MYNLSAHYENLFKHISSIIADPTLVYLHPFGSTKPENIEIMRLGDRTPKWNIPVFIFYDQEPLNFKYNRPVFDYIKRHFLHNPLILVHTEQQSQEKDLICQHYGMADIDYFFHIFAASDWFRGHQFNPEFVEPKHRHFKKTYISFNRLTSNERVYRTLLINSLARRNLIDQGHVSFSRNCPDGGSFDQNLLLAVNNKLIDSNLATEAIDRINSLPELRIDFIDSDIPNQSMVLGPMQELMESFVYLVTETCFWQNKTHLTEKIFKPIALKMPFILAGCPHNLEYLRSYGFQTFDDFWSESYDEIEDPIRRIEAITELVQILSNLSEVEQRAMYYDMLPIIEHNYKLFNDISFVESEWQLLLSNITAMNKKYDRSGSYILNPKNQQAIPIDPN